MMHVISSRRLRQELVKDERVDAMSCVRSCYHCFVIFFALGIRGIVVFFSFLLGI
jgi:hypothetical protein